MSAAGRHLPSALRSRSYGLTIQSAVAFPPRTPARCGMESRGAVDIGGDDSPWMSFSRQPAGGRSNDSSNSNRRIATASPSSRAAVSFALAEKAPPGSAAAHPREIWTNSSATAGVRPGRLGWAGRVSPRPWRLSPARVSTTTSRASGKSSQTTSTPASRYQRTFSRRSSLRARPGARPYPNTDGGVTYTELRGSGRAGHRCGRETRKPWARSTRRTKLTDNTVACRAVMP